MLYLTECTSLNKKEGKCMHIVIAGQLLILSFVFSVVYNTISRYYASTVKIMDQMT
jgi:hypothetical protein